MTKGKSAPSPERHFERGGRANDTTSNDLNPAGGPAQPGTAVITAITLSHPISSPVIAGVEITTDAAGRFNLNALHKASGAGEDKAPSQWLRRKSTKELIEELERNLLKESQNVNLHSARKSINTVNGGAAPGTFAHELLAVEYAGWISPAFRLQVNQTFLDFKSGKLASSGYALPNFDDPIQAAEAWIEAKKSEQRVIGYAHRQSRYIDHLESLFSEGLTPVQFCRRLNGINTSKVSAWLMEKNWLYDDTPNGHRATWRVLAYARDQYLTETSKTIRPNDYTSFEAFSAVLLKKGAVWLYRHYLKGDLPMKTDWNGEYTHDKELAQLVGAQA